MTGGVMVRAQVHLTEEQIIMLRETAKRDGVSVAELIRRAVDHWIRSTRMVTMEERRHRAISVVGKYQSGLADISKKHDEYLNDDPHFA
jgi:hypothetical protein